ncbi:glycosyltransferase [bacterium]|nr:glycosyltransferase [bacterium]
MTEPLNAFRQQPSQINSADATDPLISVIVPVYNVAPYLRRCVESICVQTHRNLQIILVDDGSNDGSEAMCDEFAASDTRIEVIHQSNGGVSIARNAGLIAARGAFIGFVDSDDRLCPDMYEYLLDGMRTYSAQIAICDFLVKVNTWGDCMGPVAADELPQGYWPAHGNGLLVLDSASAMSLLVDDRILQNYLWDKLYAAELWDGIRFPQGRVFEDVATTYKLIQRARRIVMLPAAKYVYEPLPTGIVRKRSIRSEMDGVVAYMQRMEDIAPQYPELREILSDGIVKTMATVWRLAWGCRGELTPDKRTRLHDFSRFVRVNPPSQKLYDSFGNAGHITLWLLRHPGAWSWVATSLVNRAYLLRHPEWTGQKTGPNDGVVDSAEHLAGRIPDRTE